MTVNEQRVNRCMSRYYPDEWLMSLVAEASIQCCLDKFDLDIMECHLVGTIGITSNGLNKCFQMAIKSLVVAYTVGSCSSEQDDRSIDYSDL